MTTDNPDANPRHRLGAACELLRQIADPSSPLRLAELVHPGSINERVVEFLASEERHRVADGLDPAVWPDATRAPLRRMLASRVPWPALATCDLWPGDGVTHPAHGAGVLVAFDDDDWPDVIELVAAGRVLVDFDQAGQRWVDAGSLARTSEADPVY